jgi:hypothetical protein
VGVLEVVVVVEVEVLEEVIEVTIIPHQAIIQIPHKLANRVKIPTHPIFTFLSSC